MSDITVLFRVMDLAQKTGRLSNLASALSNVAVTANALAKIGDVTRLSQYLNGTQFDEAKLERDGYVLEIVNGQQIVKVTKDITISAEIVQAVFSNPVEGVRQDVSGNTNAILSRHSSSPPPVSNAQIAAAEQTGDPN
jgi:hypothetical protein